MGLTWRVCRDRFASLMTIQKVFGFYVSGENPRPALESAFARKQSHVEIEELCQIPHDLSRPSRGQFVFPEASQVRSWTSSRIK